jgi:hypothetical protein
MNWVTVRRIMKIAHVVVAAATMAWRGQFFWGTQPGGCRAGQERAARPEVINRGARRSIKVPTRCTGMFCALWPEGSPHRFASIGPFGTRGPGLLHCGPRSAQHTHC